MKFVIFDIDGTLTNTKKVDDKCFMKAFEQTFDIDIWNEKWEDIIHVTDWGITEQIIRREWNRKPRKEEYEAMITNFTGLLKEEKEKDSSQFSEVSGARSFFESIRAIDTFYIGIATGAWEKSAKLKLNTIGIGLDGICFSNSNYYQSRKAITQDVIRQLTEKTKETPEQIIYFGDGVWDYKTCKKLGIDFIGIDVEKNGKLKQLGAKTVFRDYSNPEQILNILKNN